MVATAWLDNRVVSVLSTNAQPNDVKTISRTISRKQKDGSLVNINCPEAIVLYSKYMRGVDHNDQIRQIYTVQTKCKKYYKYIFWFLFVLVSTNTYILMREYGPSMSQMTVKDYRLKLSNELIGTYNSRKRPGRIPTLIPSKRTSQHYPTKYHTKNLKKAVRCDGCLKSGKRKETTWYCLDCKLHLCHTGELDGSDCFIVHHQTH